MTVYLGTNQDDIRAKQRMQLKRSGFSLSDFCFVSPQGKHPSGVRGFCLYNRWCLHSGTEARTAFRSILRVAHATMPCPAGKSIDLHCFQNPRCHKSSRGRSASAHVSTSLRNLDDSNRWRGRVTNGKPPQGYGRQTGEAGFTLSSKLS